MSNTLKRDYKGNEPTTYLVQRLRRKPKNEFMARASQVFGGAMVGMSDDGWKFCQQVFDFEYMGAAEFEFGAIPRAFGNIVNQRADYVSWSFTIKGQDITPGWWRHRSMDAFRRKEINDAKARKEKPPRMTAKHRAELAARAGAPLADVEIHVVCHKEQERVLVEKLIRKIGDGKIHTKNGAGFNLDREPGGYGEDTIGWFDLQNELLWFTDREVHEAFVKMFEIGGQS